MPRPVVEINRKGLYKVIVLLRDHSQEANLRKLNLETDAYKLVEGGRRRVFFFLFKNEWEANLLSDLYHQASLPSSNEVPSAINAHGADASDEDCGADDFEASQDVFQIVSDLTKKKMTITQPSIKEEDGDE